MADATVAQILCNARQPHARSRGWQPLVNVWARGRAECARAATCGCHGFAAMRNARNLLPAIRSTCVCGLAICGAGGADARSCAHVGTPYA